MRKFKIILIFSTFLISSGCKLGAQNDSRLYDGPGSNGLRRVLRIPIIDSYMVKSKTPAFLGGDRWDAKSDFPSDGQILHFWKIVRPYQKHNSTSEEEDAFRRKINDSVGQQMNIYSKIRFDSIVTRSGNLFYFTLERLELEPSSLAFRVLDEKGIDSVAKSWQLYYLTSNK